MYDDVVKGLRESYNKSAEERERGEIAPWKIEERAHFLSLLQQEGKKKLLEIGAGTGKDSRFFQAHGLSVTATDLSPEMVRYCRQKGLEAYVMDFLHLDFPPASFDAVYALNCLLHVPHADLPPVLQTIRNLMQPGGLFYLGLYGGIDREGIESGDHQEPKRFFAYHTDEQMKQIVTQFFELLYFKTIPVERESNLHAQSIILRRE